ncbi:hypothetical protein T12_2898 [Trichinella patagoniensis]|uniref:Uncharacterized protein n=1 Tax=Trichinella patagoniensis TaxID=990121 RepID=A0A0V0ZGN2_9BILA|nr:hypothetical protein T12_2898 [Trichinella patagoniensis]
MPCNYFAPDAQMDWSNPFENRLSERQSSVEHTYFNGKRQNQKPDKISSVDKFTGNFSRLKWKSMFTE